MPGGAFWNLCPLTVVAAGWVGADKPGTTKGLKLASGPRIGAASLSGFQAKCQSAWMLESKVLAVRCSGDERKTPHCRGTEQGALSEGGVHLFLHS